MWWKEFGMISLAPYFYAYPYIVWNWQCPVGLYNQLFGRLVPCRFWSHSSVICKTIRWLTIISLEKSPCFYCRCLACQNNIEASMLGIFRAERSDSWTFSRSFTLTQHRSFLPRIDKAESNHKGAELNIIEILGMLKCHSWNCLSIVVWHSEFSRIVSIVYRCLSNVDHNIIQYVTTQPLVWLVWWEMVRINAL